MNPGIRSRDPLMKLSAVYGRKGAFAKFLPLIVGSFFLLPEATEMRGQPGSEKVPMVVAGLSHGHSHWIFQDRFACDMEVVGIYEPDEETREVYREAYSLEGELFYDDLEDMLEQLRPEGLLAFGSTFDHLAAVEAAAPRGIHVMVEKPLAVSTDHAERMRDLAREHEIHLLTNYETSWYPSTEKAFELLHGDSGRFGRLRKALFYHGHQGPQEIGVGAEFLEWLTDPVLNGGGALVDFGCYGANLMTYLTNGERPEAVTATARTYKPQIYSRVEDDATILLQYPEAQAIIQASWNWPFNRKDMELYGETGYILVPDPNTVRVRAAGETRASTHRVEADEVKLRANPFQYFADVIRGREEVAPYSPYSLENNLLVVEILEAAKESVESNATVVLD